MTDPADRIIGPYDDKAEGWIADRGPALGGSGKSIDEAEALERFAAALPKGGTVLDVGCGSGWPWGAALLDRGFHVTGIDAEALAKVGFAQVGAVAGTASERAATWMFRRRSETPLALANRVLGLDREGPRR